MNSIWHSLIWKEWHEHKWKLVSIVLILLGVTAMAMVSEDRDRFGLAYSMLFLCIVPLSIFIGLGTAAGERSRGTLPFLQALPVPMWRVALTKLVAGLMTVVFPVILAVVGFFLWRLALDYFGVAYGDLSKLMVEDMSRIYTGNWYPNVAVICGGIAGSLYLWSAATGVNRKDEISAGAKALSIMIGWSAFLAFVVWTFAGDVVTPLFSWLVTISLSLAPGALALLIAVPELEMTQTKFVLAAWIVAAVHVLLATIYVQRFGQITEREIVSPRQAVRDARRYDWLAPPRRSPLTAIAWKQFRESGPIILAGLALTVGVTLLIYAINRNHAPLSHTYTVAAASLGFGTALVIGIGLVLNDLSPQLNTFWRSRPINADLTFWTKFAVGLIIIFTALYLPVVLFAFFEDDASFDPDAIIILPALHFAVFAAAVAMTSLVRHAVYAAILSIAVLYLGILAALLAWLAAGLLGFVEVRSNWWEPWETQQVFAGLLTTFLVSTLVAWLAVRYDWGRKSRY